MINIHLNFILFDTFWWDLSNEPVFVLFSQLFVGIFEEFYIKKTLKMSLSTIFKEYLPLGGNQFPAISYVLIIFVQKISTFSSLVEVLRKFVQ